MRASTRFCRARLQSLTRMRAGRSLSGLPASREKLDSYHPCSAVRRRSPWSTNMDHSQGRRSKFFCRFAHWHSSLTPDKRMQREPGFPQDESKIAPMMIKILLSHLQIAGLCAGTCDEWTARCVHTCPLESPMLAFLHSLSRASNLWFRRVLQTFHFNGHQCWLSSSVFRTASASQLTR